MSDSIHDFEKNRRVLLEYYRSEVMTHGGYIIALVVGFITLFSRIDIFFPTGDPFQLQLFYRRILFYFAISLIVSLGIYVVGKSLFWSTLLSEVLHTKQDEMNEWERHEELKDIKDISSIAKFQNFLIHKIKDQARKKKLYHLYWWTSKFSGINKQSASLCIAAFLVSFGFFLIIERLYLYAFLALL